MGWSSRRCRFAALALGALALVSVATQRAGAGVKSAPTVSGSLEPLHRECRPQRDFDTVVTTCIFSYRVNPALESDVDNYFAEWLQIAIKPRDGWCIAGARGSVRQPGSQLVNLIPRRPIRAGPSKPALTIESRTGKLGGLRQEFRLSRGTLSAQRSSRGDGVRWQWRGLSHKRIVLLVLGAGFARHPSADEIITQYFSRLTTIRGVGGCKSPSV
jgi:hypothetical protein